jgi:hypothetical protein
MVRPESFGMRVALALALGAAVVVGAVGATVASARGTFAPHAALLTGEYWASLTPAERQAYLSGFVAGAAVEQARGEAVAAGRGSDSAAVSSSAVAALRERRALRYPFAPSVYSAQVDDFYWWSNHRDTPIVDAMVFFNGEMLKQQQGAHP